MTERSPGSRDPGPDGPERGPRGSLQDLKARLTGIRTRQKARETGRSGRVDLSGGSVALRAGIELVGTLAVGVLIGWALDSWLGTGPWLLVVFFFVGAAAGVLNVYRAMVEMGVGADDGRSGEGSRNAGAADEEDEEEDEGGNRR